MKNYGSAIAEYGLKNGAIKLSPEKPFQWASGFFMPIYNDNRIFLRNPEHMSVIAEEFETLIHDNNITCDVIAGTATAGIPHATLLAHVMNKSMIYIRDKPKEHGLKNRIEGIHADETLEGRKVLVIEDLISFGGSSAKAVQAVRDAKGTADYCLSVFSYGLSEAAEIFAGKKPYDKEGGVLSSPCKALSLLTYDTLLNVAVSTGYISAGEQDMLKEWRKDPAGWGTKHGFPPVDKKK